MMESVAGNSVVAVAHCRIRYLWLPFERIAHINRFDRCRFFASRSLICFGAIHDGTRKWIQEGMRRRSGRGSEEFGEIQSRRSEAQCNNGLSLVNPSPPAVCEIRLKTNHSGEERRLRRTTLPGQKEAGRKRSGTSHSGRLEAARSFISQRIDAGTTESERSIESGLSKNQA